MGVGYAALTVVTGTTIAKTWADGVRDSAITQHASYAALTSAITSPSEGMMTYLTDTDTLWYYKNTNWRLLAGQVLYEKWDVSTSFFTGSAAGVYATAFTSATITVPSSGTGQAFDVEWICPTGSGAFTVGRYNSSLNTQINGGAFNAVAAGGAVASNAVDGWPTRGKYVYKAGNTDTTIALRMQAIGVGGVFDCVASTTSPFYLAMRTTGLLSSEIV